MTTNSELLNEYLGEPTLAESLSSVSRPVVIYGTGNGADKILDYLTEIGVSISGVFASDGFVRSRTFAGMRVESLRGVTSRLGNDISILMCFGSDRDEVIMNAARLDRSYDFYIPDVPLYGDGIFDREYLCSHIDEIAEARAMLSDERSVALFDASVKYRLTGRYRYLRLHDEIPASYLVLFTGRRMECIADCGAYRGDSAALFCAIFPNVRKIYSLEPDRGSFRRLEDVAAFSDGRVSAYNVAASDFCGELTFSSSSSRGAGAAGRSRRAKEKTVRAATLDSLIDSPVDLIKLDVEGDEERALRGAERIMSEHAPSIAVSLYHRTDDIWRLPLMIKNFSDEYRGMKYYLRRPRCIPCWDLTLFAVKDV